MNPRLRLILSTVAAALALGAAVIVFVREGEIAWTLIAAGLFVLTFGISAKGRLEPPK